MNCKIKRFNDLTVDELYEILQLRSDVFVLEQTCLYRDIDGLDQKSMHIFLYENEIIAYARIYEKNTCTMQIGRVISKYRGKGLGKGLLNGAIQKIEELGYKRIYLEGQEYAIGFYKKLGFSVISKPFLEDGIPHVKMEKKL